MKKSMKKRREEGEGKNGRKKGHIAYDNPGKTMGKNPCVNWDRKKNTSMQGMISLNDLTMIMKCIYNS